MDGAEHSMHCYTRSNHRAQGLLRHRSNEQLAAKLILRPPPNARLHAVTIGHQRKTGDPR
ncbi:hypothetical protein RB3304 [Rhodopirellula baltica SH 1]|uniref:Uncharacterized protein n=1 Tax=Rhodopirellula baltica (strain DSM 10527 / NCIMB 13988 / SH1) TaxID=243090 RepID=Q7UUG5_RHOBA|nr:hypothetical protein RB3304 [Rhodopirellula baltica SH 1]